MQVLKSNILVLVYRRKVICLSGGEHKCIRIALVGRAGGSDERSECISGGRAEGVGRGQE